MMKLKVILSFFLLLAFQVAFSSTYRQVEEINFSVNAEAASQLQFEENPYSPFISGEVPAGQGHSVVCSPDTQRFLSHFSCEHLHLAIIQSLICTTSIQGKTLCFGCSGNYLINIPIYLQTDNFRL
ncbi:MAG TPA: hypothetical protein VFG54_16410 [Prolixibacteraceae bacterium]|nr:hypothetical protein [Prolixibacteraceae bacterium]